MWSLYFLRFLSYGKSFFLQTDKHTHRHDKKLHAHKFHSRGIKSSFIVPKVEYELVHNSMNYTGPPKFELGRVEFASGGQGGPPVSKVNVEPCIYFMLFLHGMKIVLINTIDLLTTISSSNTEMYNQYDKMTYIKCGMFRRARSILQCYGNDCRRGFDVAGKNNVRVVTS